MKIRSIGLVGFVAAISCVSCGSDEEGGKSRGVPAPASAHPPCIISADCPDGQHCDLGECFQDCNTELDCSGQATCSPRARCLLPSESDDDPTPSGQFAGSVSVSPSSVQLGDGDEKLELELSTTSTETVRYRVVLSAPHLGIDEPRGELTGKKKLTLTLNRKGLTGLDVPGSVKLLTTLGDRVVDAPLHVGLTGRYQGSLRYDGGPIDLGSSRIVVDVREKNGDVSLRVDSGTSLLFPATASGDTTGHGSYDGSTLAATLSQAIEKSFGAERNHFARDLGRRVSFSVKAASTGRLEGTFKETLFGLFGDPVELTGHVVLELVPGAPAPAFNLAPEPAMPSASGTPLVDVTSVFPWDDACPVVFAQACASPTPDPATCPKKIEGAYYSPLSKSLESKVQGVMPMEDIASSCGAALAAKNLGEFKGAAASCALAPPLGCALALITSASAKSSAASGFSRALARTLAPSLVVAQEKVVQGLYKSFVEGPAAERELYTQATASLGPSARWVLQPGVLEYLRSLTPSDAAGVPGATDPTEGGFPGLSALARLFHVSAAIDAEQARTSLASGTTEEQQARRAAQERAVLALLEAATLLQVIQSWGTSPPAAAGATLTGVLNAPDQSFAALVQGAAAFGVPEGYVPFVYRPEDAAKGATNFEQMLAIAATPVSLAQSDQSGFESNKRAYEQNQKLLDSELASVRTSYDLSLAQICGNSFDPELVTKDSDWESCGKAHSGEVGSLLLGIDQAAARLESAESRIQGMKQKIEVSRDQLAKTQGVHASTLSFIDKTGKQLETLTWAEGVLNAEQAALSVASNSNLLNLGAPAAMAAVSAMIELEKAALAVARQRLQTAQSMRFEAASAQLELINGMAEIQKQMIDLAQLAVDIEQDVIGVLQAKLSLGNALDRAKALHEERGRAVAAATGSPATDPTYRLLRDSLALSALRSRADAQRSLYLAGRALEYEIDEPLEGLAGAVLAASSGPKLQKLQSCLVQMHDAHRIAHGAPQQYVTEVSLRRMLGIVGPRKDEVTGKTLSEGELFRQLLLFNENLDGKGGVGIDFATNLQPGNGLFATDVCADKIVGVRAQLVGDFLGDDQAQINLSLSGGSIMRSCSEDALTNWSLGAGSVGSNSFAVLQAGVNSFGSAPANTSLFGQAVARAAWRLVLPGAQDAPANADLDVTQIDDIVLELTHKALPKSNSALGVDVSCLASIGN